MLVTERLSALHSQVEQQTIDGDHAITELESLLTSVTDPYQREKLEEALSWAKIYFGAKDLHNWGGPETVRLHLQTSLYKASLARKPRQDLN
jgi:hypothetical protein